MPPRPPVDDWDAVLRRVGGSRAVLTRMIEMACEELPTLAASLRLHAEDDPEAVRRTAHHAAGTAATFDASEAVAVTRELADQALTMTRAERVDLAGRAAEELERLVEELARWRGRGEGS